MAVLSYLLTLFAIMYWMFRVLVQLAFSLSWDFPIAPIDTQWEIIVLFLTLPCLFLIVKRNLIGATFYVGLYVAYFGTELVKLLTSANGTANILNFIVILLGVIIPILTFVDILINRDRSMGLGNKKTDWFYKNEQFDRKLDERADKNQYRT